MRHVLTRLGVVAALATAMAAGIAAGAARADDDDDRPRGNREVVRFSTFNASLNRNTLGQLVTDLSTPNNGQAKVIAEIVQRNRPDVLLINEFDFDSTNTALSLFQTNYLGVSQNGAAPITYPYRFTAESNTGIPSGKDLNNAGGIGGPDDAFGFGFFPGQFGMAVYSKYPIRTNKIRTFQKFLWKDMPGALLPDDPATAGVPKDWYSPDELAIFRLSSKSHWDLPIRIGGGPSTSSRAIRRRPCSTGGRTATARGTSTRSGSGRTTSPAAGRPATSTTTRGRRAASTAARAS